MGNPREKNGFLRIPEATCLHHTWRYLALLDLANKNGDIQPRLTKQQKYGIKQTMTICDQ